MRDLFEPISRDERQAQSVQKWLSSKGRGTLECCTGLVKNGSRSVEEFTELLSGNIGENLVIENTEINSKIAKGFESSYSVVSE